MYHEGFWIAAPKAKKLALWMSQFLRCYQECAWLTYRKGLRRFAIVPKAHYLCHIPMDLLAQAQRGYWTRNPIGVGCQMQEDFVGKPSRVSRRVSVKLVHLRVLQRSLIHYLEALKVSDQDQRGMNSYRA